MGAFSTVSITRSAAKTAAREWIDRCDDEELGRVMDQLLRERLYNTRIVNDDEPAEDRLVDPSYWASEERDDKGDS